MRERERWKKYKEEKSERRGRRRRKKEKRRRKREEIAPPRKNEKAKGAYDNKACPPKIPVSLSGPLLVTIQVCPACFRDSVETIFVKQSRSTVHGSPVN